MHRKPAHTPRTLRLGQYWRQLGLLCKYVAAEVKRNAALESDRMTIQEILIYNEHLREIAERQLSTYSAAIYAAMHYVD